MLSPARDRRGRSRTRSATSSVCTIDINCPHDLPPSHLLASFYPLDGLDLAPLAASYILDGQQLDWDVTTQPSLFDLGVADVSGEEKVWVGLGEGDFEV